MEKRIAFSIISKHILIILDQIKYIHLGGGLFKDLGFFHNQTFKVGTRPSYEEKMLGIVIQKGSFLSKGESLHFSIFHVMKTQGTEHYFLCKRLLNQRFIKHLGLRGMVRQC